MKKITKKINYLIKTIPALFTIVFLGFSINAFAQVTFENTIDLLNLEQVDSDLTAAYLTSDKMQLEEAWNLLNSSTAIPLSSVKIGILDRRIDGDHPEFDGVNFGNTDERALSPPTFFQNPHGTQVTGIIGANNISSTSPLNYDFPHMNGILSGVKRLDYTLELRPSSLELGLILFVIPTPSELRFFSTIFKDKRAITGLAKERVDIINFSGGSEKAKKFFRETIEKNSDILFIVAAGKEGGDVEDVSPANLGDDLDNVLTVGAVNNNDERAPFSHFGAAVNIAAPGIDVYAPTIQGTGNFPTSGTSTSNYVTGIDGTSFATPMVTGVAGLLKAIDPNLTPAEIKQILTETADPIFATGGELTKTLGSACDNGNPNFRGCRLNALAAVKAVLAPPTECSDGIDNDGDGLIDLSDPGCSDAQDDDEFDVPLPQFILYDDFTQPLIDSSKWLFAEFVREIRDGKLTSRVRSVGDFDIFNSLPLQSPSGVTAIEADVVAETLDVPNDGLAQVRLFQKMYNDGSSPVSGIGDIFAQISIFKRVGEAPIIRTALFRCVNTRCSTVDTLLDTSFPSITPILGVPITLGIAWDGVNVTFSAGGTTEVLDPSGLAPVVQPVPTRPLVLIGTTAFGVESQAVATFDNVKVNGAFFDDFAADQIDASKWSRQEFVREIQSGKFISKVRAVNRISTNILRFKNPETIRGIRADVAVLEIGTGFPGNQVARLIGTFYKSTGIENGAGRDGDIIAAMRIIGSQTFGLQASFTMFKCLGAECATAPHIFTDTLSQILLGSTNKLLLVWDGSRFFYGLNDTVRIIDPQTFAPIISPAPGFKLLDTQAFGFGSITTSFDTIEVAE